MGTEASSQAAIQKFDDARHAFEAVLEQAPEPALAYLKPGDDYALGGLVFHVNVVLEHYIDVLEGVMTGPDEVVLADDSARFDAAHARAREGLQAGQLRPALERMAHLHSQLRTMAQSVAASDWERRSSVQIGTGSPYEASAADVLGWVTDHYQEHVPQAEELERDWESRSGST
jgi:hypothetical protein